MKWIFLPGYKRDSTRLGGKAAALSKLHGCHGIHIPPWFAISQSTLFALLMQMNEKDRAFSDKVDLFSRLKWPEDLKGEIEDAITQIASLNETLAIRSSGLDEDSFKHSFAGQFESFLDVAPEEVFEKVIEVWKSGFNSRIQNYRKRHRLKGETDPPAVIIQRMVHAELSGVAFGLDPVTGNPGIVVVTAVEGVATNLVNGKKDADTWRIDRDGRIWELNRTGSHPLLTDEEVVCIASLVRRCGKVFGIAQDIEWAIEKDCLYLLQSRPVTAKGRPSFPTGVPAYVVWDNSNIVESYSGVTTPLTFSFANRAYEGVYREFCRILAVPSRKIASQAESFRAMLGLVNGRIYYNLLNWYRVLALLPGFRVNRKFMEQMMGVKEGLPDHLVEELGNASRRERFLDGIQLFVSCCVLVSNHFLLPWKIRRFRQRLQKALAATNGSLEKMPTQELLDRFLQLEERMLTRWDAPILNDFLGMIFFGVLRRLTEKWAGDSDGALQNGLLCGQGGMISAEPARRIQDMACLAAKDDALVYALSEGTLVEIRQVMRRHPDFVRSIENYLETFGERCLGELKLESLTLKDEPLLLFRSIGSLARKLSVEKKAGVQDRDSDARRSAEMSIEKVLANRPFRKVVFRWILRNARARVRDRENLRFERTRLFGRVRRIFVELGKRLYEEDILSEPRDVFYLELDELLECCEMRETSRLGLNAARRKHEFLEYHKMPDPPNRMVETGNRIRSATAGETAEFKISLPTPGEQKKGLGCCPGIVKGPVRKILNPRTAELHPGEIIVALHTDPGWVLLFPSAGGLLVERGSVLSHSAIVARELGLPTVVSIPGLTHWLNDGEWVEFNGLTGTIHKIPKEDSMGEMGRSEINSLDGMQ